MEFSGVLSCRFEDLQVLPHSSDPALRFCFAIYLFTAWVEAERDQERHHKLFLATRVNGCWERAGTWYIKKIGGNMNVENWMKSFPTFQFREFCTQ